MTIKSLQKVGSEKSFGSLFRELTGHAPFPWQETLYREFLQAPPFRGVCDLPTGLGKTAIIAIWLLALSERIRMKTLEHFPRRLVYVVNRRTVVDQSTEVAKQLRDSLNKPELAAVRAELANLCVLPDPTPLAISTLRGEFADNAEWRDDPARPAIIVGTVDMIGSRLLFAGYGRSFKTRPLHAGFLAQDVLLVHDEAHLEPAFQQLLETIVGEQRRSNDFRTLHLMALSATRRMPVKEHPGEDVVTPSLLTDTDRADPQVARRLNAPKLLCFHSADADGIGAKVADLALDQRESGKAILIFVRKIEDIEKVVERLRKAGSRDNLQQLTGTMRGRERERLLKEDSVFARFYRPNNARPQEGTVYLICTSAGEVGIDMSADLLVCDLTPFDSMAQRFGRVNRFGTGSATIDVVYSDADASSSKSKKNSIIDQYEERCHLTLGLLRKLPDRNASPAALADLAAAERTAAATPEPTILPATDILFDAWALTTARDLPGRPPVDDWLHGIAAWDPPETYIAWRKEVELIGDELVGTIDLDDLLDDYPLKPHELIRDTTSRVLKKLKKVAELSETNASTSVWVCWNGSVTRKALKDLVDGDEGSIANRTVLLPPTLGALEFNPNGQASGMLRSEASYRPEQRDQYDVADEWLDVDGRSRRCRLWDDDEPGDPLMRLVRVIDLRPDADENENEVKGASDTQLGRRFWRWYARPLSADDEGSRTALKPQELEPHLHDAAYFAGEIVKNLELANPEAAAVGLAARWHDLGKNRRNWQIAIRNREYPKKILAKSSSKGILDLNHYRHELGSLIDLLTDAQFLSLDEDTRDLVMHLIAAHHGRARPHFPAEEVIDPERDAEVVAAIARGVPQRFARLQRRYGRWGLAYLESLVRAADILASQDKLSASTTSAASVNPLAPQ
jgi:CRISPR-associated endonuclease/helicase Cas3